MRRHSRLRETYILEKEKIEVMFFVLLQLPLFFIFFLCIVARIANSTIEHITH